ncbi:MAG TPA: metal ABC transporter ATP-binding protein [Anaerolineae bacterium]|nr:metal ABC transporter ATP-binding protein [Anaerolineae bacterium]
MAFIEELRKTSHHWIREHYPHEPNTPILEAKNLSAQYETNIALEDISFDLDKGERLAVVGPNGAGKSTLFKIIAGVLQPTSGEVHIYGHEPSGHICIAYVPQRTNVDWNFPVTIADVVMMGRIGKLGLFRNPKASDWEMVNHTLEIVGLSQLAKRQIRQLSGGQQQRMFIARALAQEAELMLMDEPLTGLDTRSQEEIFRIMDQLRNQEVTILISMHDLRLASENFDLVMLLNHKIISMGTPDKVFQPKYLEAAYGSHLALFPTDQGEIAFEDTCCDKGEPYR